jgi:small conductance mechanosensitive channel
LPHIPIDFAVLTGLAVTYGTSVIGAILIAIAGFWLANLAGRAAHSLLLTSKHMDVTVAGFLASLVRYALLAMVLIAMLQVVGIQATSLVAVLGAASLAVGLALQGTLSNMAAGVMLLLFRPFHANDRIEIAGKKGMVKDLSLFFTELATDDNVQVLIPNAQVWGAALVNYSAYPTRRLEITTTAPDGDVNQIVSDIGAFLREDPHVLNTPEPAIKPTAFSANGVEITIQAWARADDVALLKYDLDRHMDQLTRERQRLQAAE